MSGNEEVRKSPGADCRAALRARKLLATIAFSYLGISILALLCIPLIFLLRGPQAMVSVVDTVVDSFLRLPMLWLVLFVSFASLLNAEIVVELFRFGMDRARLWSDRRHIVAVLVTWVAWFSVQLGTILIVRQSLIG